MSIKSQTTTKKLIVNSVYSTISWFLIVAIGIVFTPFIVRKLTIEGYGIYALLTSLIGYYGLLDLGLGDGVTKFVAEYKAKSDWDGVIKSINTAILVQIILGVIGSGVLVIFAEAILRLLKVSEVFFQVAQQGIYFVAVGFFFTMLSGTFSAALKGLQNYEEVSKINVFMNFALNVLLVVVLYLNGGLREAIILSVLYSVTSFLLYWRIINKVIFGYKFSWVLEKGRIKSIFNYSGFLFLSRLSSTFSVYIVRFVIGFFLGPAFVAFYFIPSKVSQICGGLLGSLFNVVFPYSSELGAVKDLEKIQRVFIKTTKLFASVSIPIFLTLAVFAGPVLNLWMGPEFAQKGWVVLGILSFSSILGSITTVPNLITMGLGESKLISTFSIFTVLAYALFMPIMTKQWGIEGAACAILFAQIPGIFLIIYEIRHVFKLSVIKSLWQILAFHFVPLIVSIWLIVTFRSMLSLNVLYVWTGFGVFVSLYFVGMLLLNGLPIQEVLSHFKKKEAHVAANIS